MYQYFLNKTLSPEIFASTFSSGILSKSLLCSLKSRENVKHSYMTHPNALYSYKNKLNKPT